MPFIEWKEDNMKRMLYFLPAAGLLIGCAESLLFFPFRAMRIGPLDEAGYFVISAIACAIPAFLTGGIHLDGLADSADALASHGSPERKREILKDPHIGAFGVLALVFYVLIMAALMMKAITASCLMTYSGMPFWKVSVLLISVFVLSRALTQAAIAWIPPAAEEGMLYSFSSVTSCRMLGLIGAALLLAGQLAWYVSAGVAGLLLLPALAILFAVFRFRTLRQFGGISGDLCGRLIQLSELLLIALFCFVMCFCQDYTR